MVLVPLFWVKLPLPERPMFSFGADRRAADSVAQGIGAAAAGIHAHVKGMADGIGCRRSG